MATSEYVVKDGYTIKLDGKELNGGDTLKLTKEQAEKLHVESAEQYEARQVIEGNSTGKDTKTPVTKDLIDKINTAKSIETVEVLMSLSTIGSVARAGKARIKEFHAIEADNQKALDAIDDFVAKAGNAKDTKILDELEKEATGSLSPEGYDRVSEAIEARRAELKD